MLDHQNAVPTRPRVVIVGAGFGGLTAAKALARSPVEVTVIDRRNYHLFQPLLYQVATAGLSPADIASPIRAILSAQRNTTVLLGRVTGVDPDLKRVLLADRFVPYDYLILATGARHAYFGHDAWEAHAPGLKKIDDATQIRRRLLIAFEQAEAEPDAERRQRLLTFVVIGGGPTGVEMAGAVSEVARHALAKDFRNIDPGTARIVLIEAGPRLLPAFPESLSAIAEQSLRRIGVEVRTGQAVTDVDKEGVVIGNERVDSATMIWAAGVAASPAAKWLGAEADRAGRIKVNPDLSVPDRPEIFAIGDTALVSDGMGRPLPGVAPVAKQQGQYVARLIAARARRARVMIPKFADELRKRNHTRVSGLVARLSLKFADEFQGRDTSDPPAFRYRNLGNLATIGRSSAVVDFGRIRLHGFIAWLLWGAAHVYFLIGFRNRMAVTLDWFWAYLTFQRGVRLITGPEE